MSDQPAATVLKMPRRRRKAVKLGQTAKVIIAPVVTKLDLPPDRPLEQAIGKLQDSIVIGYDHDGDFYFSSSLADGGDVLWLIETAKRVLMSQ